MDILHRNVSLEAQRAMTPSYRMIFFKKQAQQLHHTISVHNETRLALGEEEQQRWREALVKKREQGDRTMAARRKLAVPHKKEAFPAGSWLSFACLHTFLQEIKIELDATKEERATAKHSLTTSTLRLGSKRRARASKGDQQARAAHIVSSLQDGVLAVMMNIFASVFKTKMRIAVHRIYARRIKNCLKEWRSCGRFFVYMQDFIEKIVAIQKWWRAGSKRLQVIRDKISRRWIAMERQMIAHECMRTDKMEAQHAEQVARASDHTLPSYAQQTAGQQASQAHAQLHSTRDPMRRKSHQTKAFTTLLPMEDRIDLHMADEGVRLSFIEHEMRARRYLNLPAIALWEEQLMKWKDGCREAAKTAEAAAVVGVDPHDFHASHAISFNWPPVRPSYVPPFHPQAESRGAECSEACPGRKGDHEIREMILAARKHPHGGGWKQIPRSRISVPTTGASQRRQSNSKQPARVPTKKDSEQKRPFGEAEMLRQMDELGWHPQSEALKRAPPAEVRDEELAQWGLQAQYLPGSEGPKGIRVAGEINGDVGSSRQ
jgi:hypothetical protein